MVVEQLWQPVPGGSGTYVRELARALTERSDVAVTGLSARHRTGPHPDWDPGIPVHASQLPRRALYAGWQHLRLPRAETTVRASDVVHATTWAVPPTRRPLVVTVHDLAFLDRPELFTPHGNRFFQRALQTVRDAADVVIVPSQATADDCVAHGIERGRVRVVAHGTDVPTLTAGDLQDAAARHGLVRPYLMWAGTVEPRKNVPRLLRAYEVALASDPDLPDLVLVGPSGWGAVPEVPSAVRPRVHVTGTVSRRDLHALLAGARAFVFPSLTEGFGLPVLEAMAHGVPVVTSRHTACDEVLGGTGVTVDPLDEGSIARGLLDALGARSSAYGAAGLARAARFTWQASADATVGAYAAAAGA